MSQAPDGGEGSILRMIRYFPPFHNLPRDILTTKAFYTRHWCFIGEVVRDNISDRAGMKNGILPYQTDCRWRVPVFSISFGFLIDLVMTITLLTLFTYVFFSQNIKYLLLLTVPGTTPRHTHTTVVRHGNYMKRQCRTA